ncbi:hypothetical protein TI04_05305 [Achromatium sp. WMS2]|nr:hypothetical protein TI04_05305 [Achromatium sp. WMS2]
MIRKFIIKLIRVIARVPIGSHRVCAICNKRLGKFLPFRGGSYWTPKLMHVLECVGSDVDNFSCPWCKSHDRERHLYLYMRESGILHNLEGKRVLHFAPELQLANIIQKANPAAYIQCDLHPASSNITFADITCMPFPDESFDLLIANHVLEHVSNADKALSEIVRVLRAGGNAILQTPFSKVLTKTWEDPGINTEIQRFYTFGQEDHVRLFGIDIFETFTKHGLKSLVRSHDDLLSKFSSKIYGVNSHEPFFLFVKL